MSEVTVVLCRLFPLTVELAKFLKKLKRNPNDKPLAQTARQARICTLRRKKPIKIYFDIIILHFSSLLNSRIKNYKNEKQGYVLYNQEKTYSIEVPQKAQLSEYVINI